MATNDFTKEYVLGVTKRNMLKSIDTSINKTVARVGEFPPDTEKAREVFETITTLQAYKNRVNQLPE